MKPSDMLMHVQVPVSVSFGATQIRMKDLLDLTAGSVVELDQALHDNVEVRVNDRVIARGEVVAVDGCYGVRVLELVSGEAPANGIRL
jgi:flagellar motor switch protein FliN/FliY